MITEFICRSCGRNLMQADDFSYAAFLYGVFFLEGPNDGFVGTTCPSCLKTACVFVDKAQFEILSDAIRYTFRFRGAEFPLSFRYFSPSAAIPLLQEPEYASLLSGECSFEFDQHEQIEQGLVDYRSGEYVDLYNSYGNYDSPVVGNYFQNIWVTHDQAVKLVQVERKTNIRAIPRFVFKNDLLEKAEGLFLNYEHNKRELAALSQAFDNVPEIRPIVPKDNIKEAEYHDTLTTEPLPESFLPQYESIPKSLWRRRYPFVEVSAETPFTDPASDEKDTADYDVIIQTIKENHHKDYSLKFLEQTIDSFLNDYAGNELYSVMKANWSHANIWKLVLRYLSEYHWVVEKGLRQEQNNFFYREGDGFRFRFNAKKPVSGLKDLGFHYIYYLLCNDEQDISTRHLYQVCNNTGLSKNSGVYNFEDLLIQDLIISDGQDDYIEISDDKSREFVERGLIEKRQDLATAKALGKAEEVKRLKQEIEDIERYRDDCSNRNGRKKIKRSKEVENIANAIGKAIGEALDKLSDELGNKEAAAYFRKSIKTPYGSSVKFVPADKEIIWHT